MHRLICHRFSAVQTLCYLAALVVCAIRALGVAGAVAHAQAPPPVDHAATRAYNIALGVGCEHCHVVANLSDASKPTFDFARRMGRMVQGLPTYFDSAVRTPLTQCYMCHQGRIRVERVPS